MIPLPTPRQSVLSRRDAILAALGAMLPDDAVIGSPLLLKPYETDGLSAYRQPPLAVVLPRTTAEVAAVLRYCHAEGIPVVPRGGISPGGPSSAGSSC